jgi:predicted MFS family arabinose efflux permease
VFTTDSPAGSEQHLPASAVETQKSRACGTGKACANSQGGVATPRHYAWYVTALLSVVNVFNYMDRMALSVLLPDIQAELRFSDSELGLLVGLAFSMFYAVFGVPIAMWADRGIRRNIIALALATWSVMTCLSGAAQNFWHLFLARMGVGIGEAGSLPPSQSIICDYVPLDRRPGAFAINQLGQVVGIMLGMGLAGWLSVTIGWRWAFVVLGAPGLLLALIVRVTLREPVRGRYDSENARQFGGDLASTVSFLWRCQTYRWLIVFMMTNGFVQFGLNQWWPSFYARTFNIDRVTVGVSLGTAIGIGSGVGVLLGGMLANKLAQRDRRFPLILAGIPALLALPTALATLFVPSFFGCMLLVTITGVLWAIPGGPVVAAVFSVTTPAARATAGAITILFTSIVGIGFGPLTVGLLSDALAEILGQDSLRYALLIPVAAHPVLAIAAFRAARELPTDLEALCTRFDAAAGASSR